ncbi:glycosyltransferase [Nocardioides litoris]|uniref:glycosyltransferase n=1 Tax=Nocardioides litoris TaxID=1926648 RepID=UPI00111D1223|nr:glycosyltransferase [Nocardioides litoris]
MTALTVVVVAYGADNLLDDCLAPVAARWPTLVIDNASRPECSDIAARHGARYVDAGGNVGFAGGVNLALSLVPPRSDVLLLNPDARIAPDQVETLARHLRRDPNVACVAPAQRQTHSGLPQRVAWPFPGPLRQWVVALGLGGLMRQDDYVIGAALLISGAALEDVGPFDERFFLYSEEADWQRRARGRGWRCELVTAATAEHVGGATSTDPRRRDAYFHAAHELYVRKWFGPAGWAVYRAACLAGDSARWVSGGARREHAARRLRIYATGPVRHRERLLREVGS